MKVMPTTRRGTLWRFAIAAILIITFAASATAVAGLLQFKQLAIDISAGQPLRHANVSLPAPGQPQTLLLIGSDHRAGESYGSANTDTMLLLRLDPASSTINMLSVPRDLMVQIPEGGTTTTGKLNAAYSVGGPNLLVDILQTQVFPGFHVNHIVDVNFSGFSDLVNALGCVYTDVDHRYYNNTAQTNYSSIDVAAGYQKLCGIRALQFVRFRHTDSDLVRNARQQDFLRWAKDQYGVTTLINDRDRLLKIFGQHTQTDSDLHSVDGLINLFDLVLNMAGHQIKQLQFPAQFQPCGGSTVNPVTGTASQTPCYVTASSSAEQQVYRQFITSTTVAPSKAASAAVKHAKRPAKTSPAGLRTDLSDGQSQAAALRHVAMPVYYPAEIEQGSTYCATASGNCNEYPNPAGEYVHEYPRAYTIHTPSGQPVAAYRMTLVINAALGEYYGVQGVSWQNPPILKSPTQTEVLGGRKLLEYFNGKKLSLVAWRTPSGVYWVSNSLIDSIPNQQLIGIAASLKLAKP